MTTSLGNLSLGLEIPGLAMLDAMDARLRAMEATPHVITVNVVGSSTGLVTLSSVPVRQ